MTTREKKKEQRLRRNVDDYYQLEGDVNEMCTDEFHKGLVRVIIRFSQKIEGSHYSLQSHSKEIHKLQQRLINQISLYLNNVINKAVLVLQIVPTEQNVWTSKVKTLPEARGELVRTNRAPTLNLLTLRRRK